MDIENYCVCKQRYMNEKLDELLKEIKAYRNDMVARNYPHQRISDIITKYDRKDFLEEVEKEKKELEESYKESVRQTEERKDKWNIGQLLLLKNIQQKDRIGGHFGWKVL